MKILLSFFLFLIGTLLPLHANDGGEIASVSGEQLICTTDSVPVRNLAGDSAHVVAMGDGLLQQIEQRDSTAGDSLLVLTLFAPFALLASCRPRRPVVRRRGRIGRPRFSLQRQTQGAAVLQ